MFFAYFVFILVCNLFKMKVFFIPNPLFVLLVKNIFVTFWSKKSAFGSCFSRRVCYNIK